MKLIINSEKSFFDCVEILDKAFNEHKYLRLDIKTGMQRTNLQNASLHLYCEQVAQVLNDYGLTFEQFFKRGFQVPWTMEIVKENIWRPVQIAVTNKQSTTEPLTNEYQAIYEPINLKLSEFGIHVPWPSKTSEA